MNIEGAAQQALRGAEESICRFQPKLAITVYHSLEDFWEIPKWIAQLGLGYQFIFAILPFIRRRPFCLQKQPRNEKHHPKRPLE